MKKRIIAFCFALLACSTVFTAGISTVSAMPNALYYSGAADLSEITECRGEGKVIAVIDTELNTEHEMFSAIDDKKVRYTKDDISKIISSPDFNGSSDVDSVYVNSKIPYAFCYTYDDPNIGGQEFLYHGTHVSGIAAGNRTEYEGIGISGAAPDALKLDVDVINMSFGSSYEHFFREDRFAELCEEAERKEKNFLIN